DNGRLREFLTERGLGLVHPDYRSGLRALAEEATAPFTPAQLELVVPPKPSRAAAAPTPRPADGGGPKPRPPYITWAWGIWLLLGLQSRRTSSKECKNLNRRWSALSLR
ncbi:unnamed protein product, partial [Heterosigma akashiwo]